MTPAHLTFSGATPQQLQAQYPNFQWSYAFDKQFSTRLPTNVVMIRTVVALALTGLSMLLLKSYPRLRRFVAVVGVLFAMKTIYTHLIAKDPLVEFFCKHLSTNSSANSNTQQSLEARLNQLPQLDLRQGINESICSAIGRLQWEELDRPLYRATTLDGRHVFIVRGVITDAQKLRAKHKYIHLDKDEFEVSMKDTSSPPNRLRVYVERFGPNDCIGFGRIVRRLPAPVIKRVSKGEEWIQAISFLSRENTFASIGNRYTDSAYNSHRYSGTISSADAFEIFAQLQ